MKEYLPSRDNFTEGTNDTDTSRLIADCIVDDNASIEHPPRPSGFGFRQKQFVFLIDSTYSIGYTL